MIFFIRCFQPREESSKSNISEHEKRPPTVGLTTAYNIVQMYVKIPPFLAPYNFKGMSKMLKEYIDAGKLGMSSGEGFYKYK